MTYQRIALIVLVVGLLPGCQYLKKVQKKVPQGPRFTEYATAGFDWESIQRVVVMPVANRSDVPQISDQMQQAIAAEMRRSGRFEVLMAENTSEDRGTAELFLSGQFDERAMLRLYHRYGAQGILFVKVTQYHPYTNPRMGLSMLMVSPAEGVVIAATDGMWDLRQGDTQERARQYITDFLDFQDSLFETDRVMQSPYNFQRFVAYEVSQALEESTVPQMALPGMEGGVQPAGYEDMSATGAGPAGMSRNGMTGPYDPFNSVIGHPPLSSGAVGLSPDGSPLQCEAPVVPYVDPSPMTPMAVPNPAAPPMNPVTPPAEPTPMSVPEPSDVPTVELESDEAATPEFPAIPPSVPRDARGRYRPYSRWHR